MDTRAFLLEKSISLPLVLAAVTLLSTGRTTVAFVVLGQAHFCLAYVYKYAQNGFSKRGILLYIAALLPIMLFAFLDMHRPLLITATLLFLLHAAWDEIFLVQKKPSLFTTLEIAPAALLYSGLLFDSLYPTSLAVPAANS